MELIATRGVNASGCSFHFYHSNKDIVKKLTFEDHMSRHWKQALQAALIFSALLTFCFALLSFVGSVQAMIDNADALLISIVLSFVITFIFWWLAFPSEKSGPLFLRAAWVGALVAIFLILAPVLYYYNGFDSGKFANGGTVLYLLVMLLGALFIPGSICTALAVRWIQARKMDVDSSCHNDSSLGKIFLLTIGHSAVFVLVLFMASRAVLYLTDDYVGQEEEKRMNAMGYQFKTEIENYHKLNSVYPETLDTLPTGQTKHFTMYRKWGAFAYRANGNAEYRLLWRYEPLRGIICSTDLGFWPGNASMRTEDRDPPTPNRYGCYAVDPEEIRKPPWIQ